MKRVLSIILTIALSMTMFVGAEASSVIKKDALGTSLGESGTFYHFFADPVFAEEVADTLGKVATSTTTTKELSTIKEFVYYGDTNRYIRNMSGVEYLTGLEKIHLENNVIFVIPQGIEKLPKLSSMIVLGSSVQELPREIEKCTQLETLWLSNNQLETIPDSVETLKNLKDLRLGNNQLTRLPEGITKLNNLQRLEVQNNRLTQLPENISVERLDCYGQKAIVTQEIPVGETMDVVQIFPPILTDLVERNLSKEMLEKTTVTITMDKKEKRYKGTETDIILFPEKGNYTVKITTPSGVDLGIPTSNYDAHEFMYDVTTVIPEKPTYQKFLTGEFSTSKNSYDIGYTILIHGDFKDGVTVLSREEMEQIDVQGIVLQNNTGENETFTREHIEHIKVAVENHEIVRISIDGTVGGKGLKEESFIATILSDSKKDENSKKDTEETVVAEDTKIVWKGTHTTESGLYTIGFSGVLDAILNEGENPLTSNEIAMQNITINVINNKTKEHRILTENTVEKLVVVQKSGEIVKITITGRVKTEHGEFERYTAEIPL